MRTVPWVALIILNRPGAAASTVSQWVVSRRVRVLQEEAHHLRRGIRPARIGVGARWAAAKPGMAGAVDHPLFDHRLPVGVDIPGAVVSVATGNPARRI